MKRGWINILLIILLFLGLSSVIGEVSDVSWLTDESFYESSEHTLRIDFDQNASSLVNYTIYSAGVEIIGVQNPSGCNWNKTYIFCNSAETAKFDIIALSVDSGEDYIWNIITNDLESGTQSWNLSLTVLNDSIAPQESLNFPKNFSFVKNQSHDFNITITEEESGMSSALMFYNWGSSPGLPGMNPNISMNPDGAYYLSSLNLNPSNGLNHFSFKFQLEDKAGNENNVAEYSIYVDSEAPVLDINTADSVSINLNNYNFNYDLSENTFAVREGFDPRVNCSVYLVDGSGVEFMAGSEILNDSVTDNDLTTNFSEIVDGTYQWYLECVDGAGWINTSINRTITLDRNGPNISLDSPANATSSSSLTQTFTYTVNDTGSDITVCWIYINDIINQTNFTINEDDVQTFLVTFTDRATYNWSVSCNDTFNKTGGSSLRQFTITTPPVVPPSGGSGSSGGGTRRFTEEEEIITPEIFVGTESEESTEETLASETVCNYVLEISLPELISFLEKDFYEGEVINKGNCNIQKLNLYSSFELNSLIDFSPATILNLAPGNKSNFQIIRRTEEREWPFSLFTGSAIVERMMAQKISGRVTIEGVEGEESLFTKGLPIDIEVLAPEKMIWTIKVALPGTGFIVLMLIFTVFLVRKRRKIKIPKSL